MTRRDIFKFLGVAAVVPVSAVQIARATERAAVSGPTPWNGLKIFMSGEVLTAADLNHNFRMVYDR